VNDATPLFDVGEIIDRPAREAAMVKVSRSDDLVTGIAGAALWGPLLDRLGVVAEADRRGLRPIGPGGYTGGECYRALLEVILAGGDVISDRSLLAGVANERLRGEHRLPSQWTLWRFGDGADLGRAQKAAAVNRMMLARAWALGAGPPGGLGDPGPRRHLCGHLRAGQGRLHVFLQGPDRSVAHGRRCR
jgi:hypothetical protein